jgi:hypothetical protein
MVNAKYIAQNIGNALYLGVRYKMPKLKNHELKQVLEILKRDNIKQSDILMSGLVN